MNDTCPIQRVGDLKEQVEGRGPWIFMTSGRRYFPADPRPEEIDIADIAHALSQINRYTGHTRFPLSVGQHSLLCEAASSRGCALEALLHDAAEAYIGDISRPVKEWLGTQCTAWDFMEEANHQAIAERFGLRYPWPDEIRYLDNRICATEVRDVHCAEFGRLLESVGLLAFPTVPVLPWAPEMVERRFLARFEELRRDK